MHGPSFRTVLVALALTAATPAAAASKLSVAPFGAKGAAATRQVEETLCARLECVPWERVSVNGVKDLAKARAQGVGGLLVGGTFERAGKRLLGINLYANSAVASRSWSFPLGPDGKLKAADLAALQAGVGGLLGASVAAAPRAPAPAAKKPAAPAKPPAKAAAAAAATAQPLPTAPAPIEVEPASPPPRPSAASRPAKPAKPASPPPATAWGTSPPAPPAPAPAASAPPAAPPSSRAPPDTNVSGQPTAQPRPMKDAFAWPKPTREEPRTHPYVAVELGALVTDRHLSFSGGNGGALQTFDVGLFTSPSGRIELYPLAAQAPLLAGIGLFGGYTRSIGLKTVVEGAKADTTFARLHAGLLWRVPVGESFALVPAASYETLQLTVSPAVVGLPDADLSGFRAGLGAEWTVHPRWKLLAGAGYVLWTKAQDLVKGSPAFFPGGSAAALEAEAGLSVGLIGPLSLRALGEYSGTSYSLDPMTGSSPAYVATKATDAYLGFRVALRAEF